MQISALKSSETGFSLLRGAIFECKNLSRCCAVLVFVSSLLACGRLDLVTAAGRPGSDPANHPADRSNTKTNTKKLRFRPVACPGEGSPPLWGRHMGKKLRRHAGKKSEGAQFVALVLVLKFGSATSTGILRVESSDPRFRGLLETGVCDVDGNSRCRSLRSAVS